jgi:hypothetical protein
LNGHSYISAEAFDHQYYSYQSRYCSSLVRKLLTNNGKKKIAALKFINLFFINIID